MHVAEEPVHVHSVLLVEMFTFLFSYQFVPYAIYIEVGTDKVLRMIPPLAEDSCSKMPQSTESLISLAEETSFSKYESEK